MTEKVLLELGDELSVAELGSREPTRSFVSAPAWYAQGHRYPEALLPVTIRQQV